MEAEWFPPRDLHTGDRSGFDMAAFLRLRSGERLLVSVEVKYVDTFSAKKLEYNGSLHRRVFRLSYEAPVGGCSNERRLHHLGQGSVKAR